MFSISQEGQGTQKHLEDVCIALSNEKKLPGLTTLIVCAIGGTGNLSREGTGRDRGGRSGITNGKAVIQ